VGKFINLGGEIKLRQERKVELIEVQFDAFIVDTSFKLWQEEKQLLRFEIATVLSMLTDFNP
tara:strand:- start:195 stop:380 length:186 start_codon:yes stop_codon:yes gene_type:complete